ncbi:N-acetylglucosamine-6-phosphate deacetylase [Gracilibacillus boraciitolerans]|uniref:N-acetylglucosamine-6-phosphate deacetylase n=1 Tax=Gracilibacillus boraciitolerans TaxID=307521 RepID=UPI0034E25E02
MIHLNNKYILTNCVVYTENDIHKQGFVKVRNGTIEEVGDMNQLSDISDYQEIKLNDESMVIPGMIDVHIHGANGSDVMDGTTEALENISSVLPKEGTTSFLATTMTQENDTIEVALSNVARYLHTNTEKTNAEILGIHLEGPFVNKERAGAQPIQYIQPANLSLFQRWNKLAEQNIKLVTLAPEQKESRSLIEYLVTQNIIVSAGHTDATYSQMEEAADLGGVSHITHLYNQMRGFHHRDPGVVGAAFTDPRFYVELIADGLHSSPEALRIATDQITSDRLLLITDAMRAKCLKDGKYDLGGQVVNVNNHKATLDDGTIAGSTLRLNDAFKNILRYSLFTIRDLIRITSENAAKELQIFDRKGSITPGKDADIVVLNKNYDVEITLCRGKIAYNRGGTL